MGAKRKDSPKEPYPGYEHDRETQGLEYADSQAMGRRLFKQGYYDRNGTFRGKPQRSSKRGK